MRFSLGHVKSGGFTALEAILMLGLMTVLVLMSLAIYRKETDPLRKGPGVWEKVDEPASPIFNEVNGSTIIIPGSTEEEVAPEDK